MPYINIENSKLYYEDEGAGKETIVFAHSMLFNLRMFDDQVNFLKSKYRCVRFDFRGQGKSEVSMNGYDLDTLTEDAAHLIRELNCAPCHFVGFSMGGMVALRLAIRHPELIKSLLLIDTSSEPEPQENMSQNKLLLWVVKYIGLRPVASKIMSMFFGKSFLQDPNRKPIRKTWKNYFLANDRAGIVRVVKGVLYRKGVTELLNKINKPTLILCGEEDELTDANKAEIINKGIANSIFKTIPRASHMTPVEEPDLVNEMILNFLGSYTNA